MLIEVSGVNSFCVIALLELDMPMMQRSTIEYAPPIESPIVEPISQANRYVLRLFISCRHSSTELALRNLHRALERSLLQPYTLQVVDISKHPEQAEYDHVTATPTLMRVHPLPLRRIIGHLENDDHLLHLLAQFDLENYR
jgi:circadian clock protein KaiB